MSGFAPESTGTDRGGPTSVCDVDGGFGFRAAHGLHQNSLGNLPNADAESQRDDHCLSPLTCGTCSGQGHGDSPQPVARWSPGRGEGWCFAAVELLMCEMTGVPELCLTAVGTAKLTHFTLRGFLPP